MLLAALAVSPALALDGPLPDYQRDVHPLLQRYCFECHNMATQEGHLDLQSIDGEAGYRSRHVLLEDMLFLIDEGDMPPKKSEQKPSRTERELLTAWLQGTLLQLQNAKPHDPGIVVMPRINHREYDHVVRELTGLDLEVGRFLSPDSAAGEGFLNVGEAHTMTVGQFEAFLGAAKKVMGHARITPQGGPVWSESPQPDMADAAALSKALIQARMDWFSLEQTRQVKRHLEALRRERKMVLGAYLEGAWRYRHRAALGLKDLQQVADAAPVPLYPRALAKLYTVLSGEDPLASARNGDWDGGEDFRRNVFVQALIRDWEALPQPGATADSQLAEACRALERKYETVSDARWKFERPEIEIRPADRPASQEEWGLTEDGKQPYAIDLGKARDGAIYLILADGGDGAEGDLARWHSGTVDGKPWQQVFAQPQAVVGAAASFGADGAIQVQAPSVLKLSVPPGAKRLDLTLGLGPGGEASVMGLIDDRPPQGEFRWLPFRRVLGSKVGKAAKRLHQQLNAFSVIATDNSGYIRLRERNAFVDLAPELRAHYALPQQEDPRRANILFALSPLDVILRADEQALAELAAIDRQLAEAMREDPAADERDARRLIADWGGRAWRRELESGEVDELLAFYRKERAAGASFDAAIKVPMVTVLISPHFLYRFTESRGSQEPYPLSDRELATRLAFTLWAGLPDAELRDLAAAGKLQDEAVLRQQIARMLADERSRGFAREFAGQWLQFSDFSDSASPDPERFKEFDDALKAAMAGEVESFFHDLFQNDRPLMDVLVGRHSFLNERLAKHYGIDGVSGRELRRVELPAERGGILTMGATLTRFSTPLRTSPVLRGAWLHEYVLGLHLPEPPPNVGQISDDERDEQGRSVREQLEQHRSNPSCIGCHDKIDPLGVALEHYDAIGRWRDTDLAGEAIDDHGAFLEQDRSVDGIEGLRSFLLEQREQFLRNFSTKLLGYALGRIALPTDKPLIDQMVAALEADGTRPAAAIALALSSQQFRYRRDEQPKLGAKE